MTDQQEARREIAVPEVLQAVPVEPEPRDTAEPARATYADVTATAGQKKPLVAEHWHRGKIRQTLADRLGETGYRVLFQALRVHITVPVTLAYAVKGALALVGRVILWWHVPHLRILESAGVAKGGKEGHAEAMRAHERGLRTRAARGRILAVCVVIAVASVVAVLVWAPWWSLPALGVISVPLLARYGCPEGRRIVKAAVVPARFEPPTFEIIARALADALPAVKAAVKAGKRLDFLVDVHPDGPGWGCQLNLPGGVTATQVMNKRAELSAAGRWPLSATWPSGVPAAHEGRLDLWIGRVDLSSTRPPAYPLLKAGTADVFGALPFATTPRGKQVSVPMFEMNWLIGAAPGQGKTAAVRALLAGAALDPMCDLWVHELAGKGDLEAYRKVSHRYVSGTDDDAIAYAAESVRMLRAEYQRRVKRFAQVPAEAKQDFKITRDLAGHGFRPIICVADEAQNLFMHPDFKEEAIDNAGYVIRVSRALGIILILSTQRPDSNCIPTAVTGNIIGRFCLHVPGQTENDMVLGTSARKRGYDATIFVPKRDAGQGWLKSGDDAPQVVRTYYLGEKDTGRVTARARAIREKAGVLSGVALGESADDAVRDVLADVLAAFAADPGLHWEVLAERLARSFPDRWADATGDAVSAQVRALGVPSVGVKMAGRNLQGCRRLDVMQQAGSDA
jgi:DNA segregation ATPase FtsK/SpoIIIE, S-DNA-T family